MKVVLDTNVLGSGLITVGGPCRRIVKLLVEGLLEPCVDERILAEYEMVLARPELQVDAEDVAGALEVIRKIGQLVTPTPLPATLPDARDLPFLEVAAAGAVLITGNARHFPKHARAGVTVLTPREFVDFLRGPS